MPTQVIEIWNNIRYRPSVQSESWDIFKYDKAGPVRPNG